MKNYTKVKFTTTSLGKIQYETNGTKIYTDKDYSKLVLRVGKTSKTFCVRKWNPVTRKPQVLRIGKFTPSTTNEDIERMRIVAAGMANEIACDAHRKLISLREAWELYYTNRKEGRRQSTNEKEETHWRLRLSTLAPLKLDKITTSHVIELRDSIESRTVAHDTVKLLSRVYNFIQSSGYVVHNPTLNVKTTKPKLRERILEEKELASFLVALDRYRVTGNIFVADALYTMLLTGRRKREVLGMSWEEVDLDTGTWTIPPERVKNNKQQLVCFSEQLLERIKFLYSVRQNMYVFPGRTGHLTECRKGILRVSKLAKLDPVNQQDLRRTFASYAADAGITNPKIISIMCGHTIAGVYGVSKTTQKHYIRTWLTQLREGYEKTTTRILQTSVDHAEECNDEDLHKEEQKSVA